MHTSHLKYDLTIVLVFEQPLSGVVKCNVLLKLHAIKTTCAHTVCHIDRFHAIYSVFLQMRMNSMYIISI